jgi:hypothetical protein
MAGKMWLDHRQAINCRGKRFDPEWTGTEQMAFGPVAYNRDAARILDLPDEVAAAEFDRAVQAGIDEARAAAVVEAGPPCAACGKPAVRVIDGKNYCGDHGVPLPTSEAVLKRMAVASVPATEEKAARSRAEAGREILLQRLDRAYEPERAARSRLLRQYEALREDVFNGKVRVGARWPGQAEVRPVLLDERRSRYPTDPHETRVELPSLPLPMTLVFGEADILALKGKRAGRVLRAPAPRRLSKAAAVGIARQFLSGRNGQKTTQDDLWNELKQHGRCPRSMMRDVAKACGMPGRGRPRSKIAAGK